MPSATNRRTVRRSRSTVQLASWPRFSTRTTSPHGWSGRVRRTVDSQESHPRQDTVEMRGVAAGLRVAGAQAGPGALGNQRPLQLGDGAQNLRGEHALRRGRVDSDCRFA